MTQKEIESNFNVYKFCFVPGCKNTVITAPTKVFIQVPANTGKRKLWCEAVGYQKEKLRKVSFCCEDHFDLKNDMENYMQWKMMGSPKVMKDTVVPHLALNVTTEPLAQATAEEIQHCSTSIIDSITSSDTATDISSNTSMTSNIWTSHLESVQRQDQWTQCEVNVEHQYVQARPTTLSKHTQTKITPTTSIGVNCDIVETLEMPTVINSVKEMSISDRRLNETVDDVSSSALDSSSTSCVVSTEKSSNSWSSNMQIRMLKEYVFENHAKLIIEDDPQLFIGINKECMFIIELLQKASCLNIRDIYFVLKKIKTNLPYSVLSYEFGLSDSQLSRIFRETVHKMSSYFKQLIIWPDNKSISLNLPLQFRHRYSNVHSIIDCFEIEIEKPLNAMNQALTWSDYKKCNTSKYLIAVTPDGLIIFISKGICGRRSDMSIVEKCGYLEKLPPKASVLADRGFKHLDTLLQKKDCNLIRPPSVINNVKPSKGEVKLTKQIASIRIHVERTINRVRNFQLLNIHTRVDNNLIDCLDAAMTIVGGLVNLQNPIIKQI